MALVAYDDSDMSDEENDVKTEKINLLENNIENSCNENKLITDEVSIEHKLKLPPPKSNQEDENGKFLKLPQPKESTKFALIEEDDEFLRKKEIPEIKPPPLVIPRKPVKIQLPALSELIDEEDPTLNSQIRTNIQQKSGLLGILPPPKEYIVSNKSKKTLIPHVLSKKPAAVPKPNKNVKKPLPQTTKDKPLIQYASSDESDSEQIESSNNDNIDFFSLKNDYKIPDIPYEEINNMKVKNDHINGIPQLETIYDNQVNETPESYEENFTHITNEKDKSEELPLDEEALRQLCGSRAKRFKAEHIQVIDMSHKDVLPNEEEWMREALQETTAGPKISHGIKPLGGPSSTQKRKHQITYLAQQAKANEIELQNQWASNRMTRRQTQSKYGF